MTLINVSRGLAGEADGTIESWKQMNAEERKRAERREKVWGIIIDAALVTGSMLIVIGLVVIAVFYTAAIDALING